MPEPDELDFSEDLKDFKKALLPDDEDLELSLTTMSKRPIPTAKLLKIDHSDLRGECESYAAWLAVISVRLENFELKLSMLEHEQERVEASAYLRSKSSGMIKKSEAAIKAEILMDPEVEGIAQKVFACQQRVGMFKSLRSAFYAKRDMILAMTKDLRIGIGASQM